MKKKFKVINAIANEVSLCSKDNSGANKKTSFEIVKNENAKQFDNTDFQEFIKYGLDCCYPCGKPVGINDNVIPSVTFLDYIAYHAEDEINNALYCLLTDALRSALCDIKYMDISKESKILLYQDLFKEFVRQYENSPITKSVNGEFVLSNTKQALPSKSVVNPQTVEEIGDDMEEKQVGIIKSVVESLKSLISPTQKSKEPAVEPEVQAEGEEAKVEEPAVEAPKEESKAEEPKAEESEEEKPEVEEPKDEDPAKEPKAEEEMIEKAEEPKVEAEEAPEAKPEGEEGAGAGEAIEPAIEDEPKQIEKASIVKQELEQAQAKIAELEKAQRESLEVIEKAKFVEQAKADFSMLVGTPEEIGEKLYSISKSNLPADVQDFILENLKNISKSNAELTKEVGTGSTDIELSNEELEVRDIYKKAEAIAKAKNISINKALREV